MALTLELETLFLEVLNISYIYPITSKVHFVKGLAKSILTYIPNMIHICPNISKFKHFILYVCFITDCQRGRLLGSKDLGLNIWNHILNVLANREKTCLVYVLGNA